MKMLNTLVDLRKVKWRAASFCLLLFMSGCSIDISKVIPGSGPSTEVAAVNWRDVPDNKNDLIRAIQGELNGVGYNAGPADGLMGKKTRNAIKSFQQNSGLKVDGAPSAKVLLALREQHHDNLATGGKEQPDPAPKCEDESDKSWLKVFDKGPTSVIVDCSCQQLVEPFEITSNVKAAATIAYEESKTGMEKWLNNILRNDYQPDIQLKDVKKAAKRMNWMPLELEKKYGELVHEKRKEAGDLRILRRKSSKRSTKRLYEKVDGILAQLLSTIPSDQPYEFKALITASLEVNAEAIPGGTIYISRGALEQDQGYFVLGHELAHVSKRHTTKAFQSRLIDTTSTVEELRSLISGKSTLTNILDRSLALNKILIEYNQAQELQSDACAVRMLTNIANVKPDSEIERFVKHLANKANTKPKKQSKKAKEFKFLGNSYRIGDVSSHPDYPERIKQIESISSQMSPG